MTLNIETMALDKLKPYENNAKEQPQEQIDQIAESIEQFGMNDPIAVWGKDNLIVEGYGRWEACKLLGMTEAPVIRLDHLTVAQRKAYTLAHNKLTMNSGFDLDLLAAELDAIEQEDPDIDMALFGFDTWEDEEPEPQEDNYEGVLPAEPKSKLGEKYRLGDHILLIGDATEDIERLMDGEEADLLLTDPPYNVDYVGKTKDALQIDNDNLGDDAFVSLLQAAFEGSQRAMRDGAAFYVWYASRTHIAFEEALQYAGLSVRQQLIWAKTPFVLGRQDYQWQHEPILYGWKDTAPHYFTDRRDIGTVFDDYDLSAISKQEAIALLQLIKDTTMIGTVVREKKPAVSDLHPTMKPVTILGKMILNSTQKGDIVLDPFGGSGSTLIACEQTHRRCRIMELDPRYADVIIDRWETQTGERAKKVK